MHNVSWDDLKMILAVAEAGSVNAAARALGVNHATVLRRIGAYEARTGMVLFSRDAAGYRLAPGAEPVIAALRRVATEIQGVERAVAGGGDARGPVRITSTDSLCHGLLPDILRDMAEALPELSPTLAVTNAHLDLARMDADLSLRPARTAPDGLLSRRVGALGLAVFAAPEYWRARAEDPETPHRWLGGAGQLASAPIADWLAGPSGGQVVMCSDSFVTLAQLAARGLGAAMMPEILGEAEPGLTRHDMLPQRFETSLWIAAHPDLAETPRIRACMEFIAAAVAAHPLLGGASEADAGPKTLKRGASVQPLMHQRGGDLALRRR